MDYLKFQELMVKELPINRKERFYTGTVFPALVMQDNWRNLFHFLREIEGFPSEVGPETTGDSFLFYTEYNLKESGGPKSVGLSIPAKTADTPDIVIEILGPIKVLVVIEAKMFANVARNDFSHQMKTQREVMITAIKTALELTDNQVFHVGLTPRALGFENTPDYQIINWEFFIDNPRLKLGGNHFLNYLRFALDHYPELVSTASGVASTVEGKLAGSDIYEDGKDAGLVWVGRSGGRESIIADAQSGKWRYRKYDINSKRPAGGRQGNWLSSREFAQIVDDFGD